MHDQEMGPSRFCRRELLRRSGLGFGSLALGEVLANSGLAADQTKQPSVQSPLTPKPPHFPAKAKHVIHIFLNGGCSHVDTFDPKPALEKFRGKELPLKLRTERKTGFAFPSPFRFKKYGESGIEVSDLFRHVGEHVDKMTVVRSMHADVPNHEPSLMLMNCGAFPAIRPAMGSWVTYGLGSECQNLPGFVVLIPNGHPIKGAANWRSSFLPGAYQGTYIETRHTKIEDLIQNIKNDSLDLKEQRQQLDLLQRLNREHQERRSKDDALEARIQSFELAYRMQMEAADVFDLSQEPKHIHELYGPGVHARQLLVARRMVERGVRFIQLWHGAGQPWDNHDDLEKNHANLANQCDQGIGALLKDLDQRGLLDETLVFCSGEFGRTPVVELPQAGANQGKINGRDHNHYGFTTWLAGGGVKGGQVYGATDEFGFKAVENPVHVNDLQATIPRLLGFDHKRLTYHFAGRDFRLTDLRGEVVDGLIA